MSYRVSRDFIGDKMSLKQFCSRCTQVGFPPPPFSSLVPFLPFSAVIGFCIKSRKGIKVFHFNSSYASGLDRVKPEQTMEGREGRRGEGVLRRIDLFRLVAMVHFRGNNFFRGLFHQKSLISYLKVSTQ